MVFGASSLYLVLKVGITVSASIPVAVLAITTFRVLSKFGLRDSTILENNIVQTAGSAGESIAFGLGVTMPAIMILGFDLEIVRVMLVAILGGLLGILMMIPTRRALIVHQHGYLKYPEGTACAEVLKAGASAESREAARSDERSTIAADEAVSGGKIIIGGFIIGFIYYGALEMLKAMKEIPEKIFAKPFQGASISLENNPALLGVGYIIGPRIAGLMMGGGVLSYLVLIPAIKYFGSLVAGPVAPETGHTIAEMSVDQIQHGYILYIGAGAVAAGGIISLIRSLPLIWHGLKGGLTDLREARAETATALRTDQDLSMKWVIGGIILLLVLIMIAPQLNLRFNLLGALLIVGIGFLFTTVSSRLTGEVGSSSCPTSGITVATLLLTCLVFLIVGWTAPPYFVTALSIGGIVCIASSNGGTTSQDLKTGFLIGSTPKYQQIAILIGTLASCIVIGPILMKLNESGTVYIPVAGNKDFTFASAFTPTPADFEKDSSGRPKRERLAGAQAGSDSNEYFVFHKTSTDNGPAGRYLVNDTGFAGLSRRSGYQRHLRQAPRWLERAEVHRTEGDVDVLHHQRNSRRPIAVGTGVARRFHLDRARAFRNSFARFCRRRLSSDLDVRAGLGRRSDSRARRQLHASQTRRRELHRRSARCRRRQEQRSPLVIRLHRGRDPGGSRFRLLEYSVERHLRRVRKMGDRTQSILRRPARRSARDDSVRCALRPALSRRPRCSVHAESEAHELGIRLRFLTPRQVHWNPGQHD